MNITMTSRGLRAALLAFSSALLFGLAACSDNQYGPPVEGEPLSWGQQHYVNVQKAQANHDSGRSDRSSSGAGIGTR